MRGGGGGGGKELFLKVFLALGALCFLGTKGGGAGGWYWFHQSMYSFKLTKIRDLYRGYYMAAWRYEISLQVLRNIFNTI